MPNYKIADLIWNICPKQADTKVFLKEYETLEQDYQIVVPAMPAGALPEYLQILQYMNDRLAADYQGLMIHAAVIVYDKKAYLFVALPGTGKTTHICLWKQVMGDRVCILNGDKPFLRIKDGQLIVYGGPWRGKENFGFDGAYPLGGVYLLRRGEENRICQVSSPEKLKGLLDAILLGADHRAMLGAMEVLDLLCRQVPVNVLYCNMETDAVDTVRKHIEEEGCEN